MRIPSSLAALTLVFAMVAGIAAAAEETPPQQQPSSTQEARRIFGYGDATVLGLVEGITEFLPISSTGHLILANAALGLDVDEPTVGRDGQPLWLEAPDPARSLPGRPFTVRDAAATYTVAIQAGAIAAVALLYRRRVRAILEGLVGRNPAGLRLARNIVIACIPAVVVGLTLDDWIEAHLFNTGTVAAALIVGAAIMVAADRHQRARASRGDASDPDPADLSWRQSLVVGALQCVAMWPGMSRSMMTIVGGYVVGLRPARAAEFSFLLGLPTLTGAAFLKSYKTGALTLEAFGLGPLAWGAFVAAVSAALAVTWLVHFLTRHGLALFAWYRVALAAGVLVWMGV